MLRPRVLFVLLTLACAPASEPARLEAAETGLTECTEPRPEMCTQQYSPVCAERDTGLRCVKAPCPGASEWKTYSNGCSACADPKVLRYRPEACAP